jgi:uncharacterized protein (DUF433 family)
MFREQLMATLDRITQDPAVMGGKPCIRGLRVTVGAIVGQIGAGRNVQDILGDYPYLEQEDVDRPCYAAWRAENTRPPGGRMKLLVDMNLSQVGGV